jgi:hypothetical protein
MITTITVIVIIKIILITIDINNSDINWKNTVVNLANGAILQGRVCRRNLEVTPGSDKETQYIALLRCLHKALIHASICSQITSAASLWLPSGSRI